MPRQKLLLRWKKKLQKTFGSKLISGLYITGEAVDIDGVSGGSCGITFKTQYGIDHMLDSLRTCDRAVLGDAP